MELYPPNQTLVVKGVNSSCNVAELDPLLRGIAPDLVSVVVKEDLFPSSKVGYSKLAYLNFSSHEKAKHASSQLQSINAGNLQGKYRHLIDLENFQVFLKSTIQKDDFLPFFFW